jgi:hypothetical protein
MPPEDSTGSRGRTLRPYRPIALPDLVRVGRDNDGGYVLPSRIPGATTALIGLGISTDWSFERAFAARNPGVRIIGVDGSISLERLRDMRRTELWKIVDRSLRGRLRSARETVSSARELGRAIASFESTFGAPNLFIEKFITDENRSHTVTWNAVVAQARELVGATPRIFLKMDIEGAEYRVLPSVLSDAELIVGLAIEFHDCDLMWPHFVEVMNSLCRDFHVAHVHGNNWTSVIPGTSIPRTLEVTLIHRSLVTPAEAQSTTAAKYPRAGLDQPNHPSFPDLPIDFEGD